MKTVMLMFMFTMVLLLFNYVLLPQGQTEFFICSDDRVLTTNGNHNDEYLYVIRNNTDNSTKADISMVKFLYTCGINKILLL